MTSVTDLQCTITFDGVSQSGHITGCKLTGNLIEIVTKFTVMLDEAATRPAVGATTVITMGGSLVLTGRANDVHSLRDPEEAIRVEGRDNFWRAQDYFIDDPDLSAKGETVSYWIARLCGLCGLSYTLPDSGGEQPIGSLDTPASLGMVYVVDSLRQICALPGWMMRMTAAGALEFVVVPEAGAADEIWAEIKGGNRTLEDQFTRNVVKIWGYTPTTGDSLLYQQRVAIAGIVPDRIMVVSTPNITTVSQAQSLAGNLLTHFGNIDEIADVTLPEGLPSRRLGMIGEVTIEPTHIQRSILTDLESTVDKDGYQQAASIGRKNFYLPYYPPGNLPPEWEGSVAHGTAYDCFVMGDSLYVVGVGFRGDNPASMPVWRIERRLLIDGSLVWAQAEDISTSINTPTECRAIYMTSDGSIYLTGVYCTDTVGNVATWRVEKRDSLTGGLTWATDLVSTTGAAAYDLVASDSGVWVTGRNLLVGLYGLSTSGVVNFSKTITTVTAGYPVVPFQMGISSAGLILGGGYVPPLSLGYIWMGLLNFLGTTTWEYLEPQTDPSSQQVYAIAVDTSAYYRWGSGFGGASPKLAKHGAGGGIAWEQTVVDAPTGGVGFNSHMDASGNYIYAVGNVGNTRLRLSKVDGSTLEARAAGASTLHGVAFAPVYGMTGVCGSKGGMFWSTVWES